MAEHAGAPLSLAVHLWPPAPLALAEALEAAVEAGALPTLPGLSPATLVRWLYRAAQEAGRAPGPLAILPARGLATDPALPALVEALAGGWLLVVEGEAPADLRPLAAAARLQLFTPTGPTLTAPPALVEAIQAAEAHHLVAVDPGLREARRSLAAHAAAAGAVLLVGPPGAGKAALAAWAGARGDRRPLSRLWPGGPARPHDGCWALFEEVNELSADQVAALRQRLSLREGRPPSLGRAEAIPRPAQPAFAPLLGESPALAALLTAALRAAPTGLSVLLLGEPGTGKELLARALHEASGRRGAFVAVDLSAVPEGLLESELFGHVRGAYTGADRERKGALRAADGGTLFLDELGNLSLAAQARLLRVLGEQVVRPVGGDGAVPVSVRVIAATNAPVEQMAGRGEFRADLLDRLSAITLRLPPLRERGDDLLLLAAARWRARRADPGPWCAPGVTEALRGHPWPGNLRELLALIDQAAATAPPGPLRPEDLGPLAPENRRPVALFATHSGEGPLEVEGLPRALLHALSTVTLRVPGLRNRGLPSLRQTLLHHLAGMPLHASALVALEALPWWGNQPQIAAVVAALRASPLLDAAAVHQLLPPRAGGGAFPIRALLHPTRRPTGEVGGWMQEIEEAGVLVGRARSVGELSRALGEADPRIAALRQHLGGAAPACLTVGADTRVSRAQALVIRQGDGLAVVGIPGAVPCRAGPLGGALSPLVPGEALPIGRAGRLLVGPAEAPALCVWFFAGAAAFAAEAGRALDEAQSLGRGALLSMELEPPPPPVAPRPPPPEPPPRPARRSLLSLSRLPLPPPRGRHVWLLDPEEIALLNHLVLGFRGGDFSGWLQDGLRAAEGPAAARLRAYVSRTRAAQYCCRLYAWEPNKALRADLRARLGADPETRLRLLPTDIGRSLMG